MGLFPPGSTYQGMTVWPVLTADEFLLQVVLAKAHPGAAGLSVVERKKHPETAQGYGQRVQAMMAQPMTFAYDAATVTVTYDENGVRFREVLFAIIQDWGELGAGMWGNRETVLIRAPVAEFAQLAPILQVIQGSVRMNPRWVNGEIRGQLERSRIALDTQREIDRIDQEIVAHRQKTMAEIQNDMYLTLTGQEEYVNPFTGETERDTDRWKYRWVNDAGDVAFADREDYDPNQDLDLNRQGWERSLVRRRFPE
jgi:hypothetical protein